VALLNDAKYGYDARDNVLSLTLLRSPLYPDPLADEGSHRFTYSLFPHPGDWTEGGVVDEAFSLNSPPIVVPAGEMAPREGRLLRSDGLPLALGTAKRADNGDGLIIRVYEPHSARGRSVLRFARPVARVERVNLLEEPEAANAGLEVLDGDSVSLDVRPFEVISFRIVLK
jgi:alpha-mannosidase